MSLRVFLKQADLTQRQLAKIVGVSEPTVSRWVTGTALVPTEKLRTVADTLRVSIEELVPKSPAPSSLTDIFEHRGSA
ncbi:helix-turn-helix transcriptional regulator [Komagataeibacter xylinus]|uniref:Helix-turn-helix transcriptional regulator n=1 Tax=Komagataeibacter xylinus TaxID=28448 RepID=A0A857FMF6_KOMXY|nr:helix-turn-helix transcriptional regulator [Komagataeibacter xylinus]